MDINYWDNHNWAFLQLLLWMAFPRISFIFISLMTGGFFFWLGVIFVPRIMMAYWATYYYWDTNYILCIIAWFFVFCGESYEKKEILKIPVRNKIHK